MFEVLKKLVCYQISHFVMISDSCRLHFLYEMLKLYVVIRNILVDLYVLRVSMIEHFGSSSFSYIASVILESSS